MTDEELNDRASTVAQFAKFTPWSIERESPVQFGARAMKPVYKIILTKDDEVRESVTIHAELDEIYSLSKLWNEVQEILQDDLMPCDKCDEYWETRKLDYHHEDDGFEYFYCPNCFEVPEDCQE